jgi:hypothetical protein
MGLIAPKTEEAHLTNLIHIYLTGHRTMAKSQRVKDVSFAEGEKKGYRHGLAEGIATILSIKRVEAFPELEWVEQVMDYEVVEALQPFITPLEDNRLQSRSTLGEDERTRLREEFDSIMMNSLVALTKLAEPEQLIIARTKARREKILLGKAEPLAEDREWLESHLAEATDVAKRTKAMLAKVPDGLQKVNR